MERPLHSQAQPLRAVLDSQQQVRLGRVRKAGHDSLASEFGLDTTQQRTINGRGLQAAYVEELPALVRKLNLRPLRVKAPNEEGRLLDLDLTSEAPHLNHVDRFFWQVAHAAVEQRAQAGIEDGLPLVAPAPIMVQEQADMENYTRLRAALGPHTDPPNFVLRNRVRAMSSPARVAPNFGGARCSPFLPYQTPHEAAVYLRKKQRLSNRSRQRRE